MTIGGHYMKSIVYIGMDVHKNTFSLCALDGTTGEILGETQCASEPKLVEKFVQGLSDRCALGTEFQTGYEAGILGYSLYRSLTAKSINCVILAPTTMFSASKNKVVKNDKMDARMIAQNLAAHTYHAVYVPDSESTDVKEYIRMRKDTKKKLVRCKQQLDALLTRQGYRYNATKTKWTQTYMAWIKALSVPEIIQMIIDESLIDIEVLQDKLDRFDRQIEVFSRSERYEESINKLRCFKGIATTSAMTIHVETADFSRFPSARAYMAYLGLTPSEHSSGNHISKGSITKQGNSVIRTILVECSQTIVRGTIGHKPKCVKERQVGQNALVINYADRAITHLQRKYRRMIEQGKQRCIAIAAVARELAGFIWGIETGNINY